MVRAPSVLVCVALWVTGCGGPHPDSDTDSDSDLEEDTDGEKLPPYLTFVGDLAYRVDLLDGDGGVLCDADIELHGTRYTGACPGCEFAFAIDADLVRDDGDVGCTYLTGLTYLDGDFFVDPIMAFVPRMGGYTNLFVTGVHIRYGRQTYGPYWDYWLSYEGSEYGTFTRTGDEIAWTFEATTTFYSPHFDECWSYVGAPGDGSVGGASVRGSLPCDREYVADIFAFAAPEGAVAAVAVDTVDAETTFDPFLFLVAPDRCEITGWEADDEFPCTHPPPAHECPSWEVETEEGEYRVLVSTYDCAGSIAEYELRVELRGADVEAPDLVQVGNDVQIWPEVRLRVEGRGTMSR